MKCIKPFTTLTGAFGCGQCLPCRIQKRRTWAHRILLEAEDVGPEKCSFATLTYSDDVRTLRPVDLQNWLKRLRKRRAPQPIRFFACGEYGDQSWRPHYHVALFGHASCVDPRRVLKGEACLCPTCSDVRETWGFGHIKLGTLTAKSAQYVAGYVTKKMTRLDDPRLNGRHPEFARMSLRPGIGAAAMHNVASEILRYDLHKRGDVPLALRHGSIMMPLGRYCRGKLREMVGKDAKAPAEALQEGFDKLRLLRAYALENDRSVASVFAELNQPYADQMAAKLKMKERPL